VGGAGISNNSALAVGGSVSPRAQTENYNGSSWTEVNDLNNGRTYADCAGTATAALAIGGAGGSTPATAGYVESWDGTNWTEVADLLRGPAGPQSTVYGMASGIQTSALYYGGDEGSTNVLARTESWNGSAWTEVNDLNQARSYGGGIGTSNTSALCVSGLNWNPGSSTNDTSNEQWNGSSWTELAEPNQGRGFLGSGNYGSVTSALIFGGRNQGPNAMIAATESWNGSAWTEVADLATARLNAAGGSGTATAAMFAGGGTPSVTAVSEEWSFGGIDPSTTPAASYSNAITGDFYYNSTTGQFKQVNTGGAPIGSWSSGGNLNTARYGIMSGGDTTAAIAGAGNTSGSSPGYVDNAESYDGSSWSEVSETNTAKGFGASGTQTPATAALIFGGNVNASPDFVGTTEYWNGSSWTELNDLNTARTNLAGAGSAYTAALAATGKNGGGKDNVESFNGSSWTEIAEVNTTRPEGGVGTGTNTAAFVIGGTDPGSPPGGRFTRVEEYDGSSWTETTDINTGRAYMSSAGSVTDSLIAGGNGSPPVGNYLGRTEGWNGTAWTEVADLGDARYGLSTGTGTGGTNLFAIGGDSPPMTNATEEWAAADFQIKSVTTS
jgi:hypothetical protein